MADHARVTARLRTLIAGVAVLLLALTGPGLLLGAGSAAADDEVASTGVLQGRVVDATGEPVEGLEVYVQGTTGSSHARWPYPFTDSDGRWSVPALSGEYRVRFEDPDGVWAQTWVGGVSRSSARIFPVANGTRVELDEIVVARGATIAGKVTGAGEPLLEMNVKVFAVHPDGTTEELGSTGTGFEGEYAIKGLRTDLPVVVQVSDGWEWWATSHHPGSRDVAGARQMLLEPGSTTRVDEQLKRNSHISGRIDFSEGVTETDFHRWTLHQRDESGTWRQVRTGLAHPLGHFQIDNVEPGTYRVGADGREVNSSHVFYPNAATVEEGQDVVVGPEELVSGIQLWLHPLPPVVDPPSTEPPTTEPPARLSTIRVLQRPRVKGTPAAGKVLRAHGTYRVAAGERGKVTARHRWYVKERGTVRPIRGATARAWRLPAAMADKRVQVRVTLTAPGHAKRTVASVWVKVHRPSKRR